MAIERYFTDERYLPSAIKNYRVRPTQIKAAEIISSSLAARKTALIEAPTGSGKSMAYLISAYDSGKKIIVATKTKQLMSQLLDKDIPTVSSFMGDDYTYAKLMGRKNYFCPDRFYKYIMPNLAYYSDVVAWFETNKHGGIIFTPYGKFDLDICNLMSADRYQCKYSKCNYHDDCPFYIAKDTANGADLIITNHHLLLSDIAMKMRDGMGSIFDYRDSIIFDEAHSLPDTYAEYAGDELSLFGITLFFKENKLSFSLEDITKINDAYFDILKKLGNAGNDKFLYDKLANEITSFVELGEMIVSDGKDNDLYDEYKRYRFQLQEINSDKEGLRFVERYEHKLTAKFTPFDISDTFADALTRSALSSIFISATLSINGNFDYFIKETGLGSDVNQISLDAAFDFNKQGKLFIYDDNNTSAKDKLYKKIANDVGGSILIIVNSLERLRSIYELLKHTVKNKKVFSQTEVTLSKMDLSEDIILIGAAILREGIDLSRGGFKTIIIDKLPFEYPEDLYLSGKADKIKAGGGNSFMEYFLPRAVLYFKQAVGRLIRHEDDIGLWVVLDDRIITKKYGNYFKDVLKNVDRLSSVDDAIKFVNFNLGGRKGYD